MTRPCPDLDLDLDLEWDLEWDLELDNNGIRGWDNGLQVLLEKNDSCTIRTEV